LNLFIKQAVVVGKKILNRRKLEILFEKAEELSRFTVSGATNSSQH
jgi:hypothetical protein